MGTLGRAEVASRGRARTPRRELIAALLSLIASSGVAAESRARSQDPPDFTGLSLEELLRVELVYAASRRAQSVGEAPSMVTVIGRDEIRRQGYRTMADLLRAVPGFYVSTDHNYTYVGVRGFARPGDYNARVLVLVNGVRLNDNVYDAVLIGNDFALDLDIVERVEVARGPGASLFGNNAFFAVVNVVTRKGGDLRGAEIGGQVGSFGERGARATWGTRLESGLELLASASAMGLHGADLCFESQASGATCPTGRNGETGDREFLSASWKGFEAQVLRNGRSKEIPTGAFGTVPEDARNRTWDGLVRSSIQYARSGEGLNVAARLDHGQYRYSGRYILAETRDAPYRDETRGQWWTLDGSVAMPLGGHLLTAGTELQWDVRLEQRGWYEAGETVLDVHATGKRWGIYAQDQVRLSERLQAQVGLRHDVTADGLRRTSPRLSLVYAGPGGSIKLLYGSAYRAPNQFERRYYAATAPDLRAESIRTLELVGERGLGSKARLTAALFDNRITDLVTLAGEATELGFVNDGRTRSRGIELVADWRDSGGRRARLGYTFQRTTDAATERLLTNSPAHLAKLSLDAPLPARLWVGSAVHYTSSRLTLAGARLPGFVRADVTLHAPALRRGLDLTLGVSTPFDASYAQPGSEQHLQDALVQDGRALVLEAAWRF